MPRRASGPPVAESASAASHRARQTRVTASSRGHVSAVADLDHRSGVQAPRAGGDVVALLVPTAGHVVGEQSPDDAPSVESGEEGDDDHALHRRREVAADHHRELVRLALEAQRGALDLLVVLQLQLEQSDHLHRRSGGSGDRHAAELIGLHDLLHRPVRDQVAGGGPPVARQHDAVRESERDARGPVRDRQVAARRDGRCPETDAAQQFREVRSGVVDRIEDRH